VRLGVEVASEEGGGVGKRSDDAGRLLAVPSVVLRTEVIRRRVLVSTEGRPARRRSELHPGDRREVSTWLRSCGHGGPGSNCEGAWRATVGCEIVLWRTGPRTELT